MNTSATPHDFQADIDAIGRNQTIPILLETVLLATGMGFAAVARVTDARWVTCRALDQISFGLTPGDELDVETTLCNEVRQFDQEIVIDDVRQDPLYRDHPCPQRYGFRSYISIPIRQADGTFFGTLCAIDPAPRQLRNDRVLGMFRLFARMIAEALDADEAYAQSQLALSHERDLASSQEKFIAILAHDLRNPIGALSAGLRMMERRDIDDKAAELVKLMRGSVNRMGLLIENLLDQARKRSGGGMLIERTVAYDLDQALLQIVSEFQAVAPEQTIQASIDIPGPVHCDVPRICQLFSNLLSNAVSHGRAGLPIEIGVSLEGERFALSISNYGDPIPEEQLPSLFEPFKKGPNRSERNGLGLGLFIASEIAKGHDGNLSVSFEEDRNRFSFVMRSVCSPQ
ncbi:GAF domain-containing sensor histidine kinase [Phaeobacter sp. B1627]|uniref:GAF domain-containing sensor histidine kinase n=1 Tax=Phaeobacter sp. B1627 TaxID=2583809 RepID=UPI002107EE73|nr:GAF domain-containing sensor histidine kinase [Phaeobacter sp. B1627]